VTPTAARVRKGYVRVEERLVHYRIAGSGPPVVLLHDSPRSSAMHEPLLGRLGRTLTAIALDTPGYGRSTPLAPDPVPDIPRFADALAATLAALGLPACPVYGFHTSSKIAIACAVRHPRRVRLLVCDGLNLPRGGADESFISRYMAPYVVREDGSHLAATWSRARDLHRFFPWFEHRPESRLRIGLPDPQSMHAYVLDMLRAGPHYATAYASAMRFDALPWVPRLTVPAVFMCREDDPLYPFLDVLPPHLPAQSRIERLSSDPEAWAARLEALLGAAAGPEHAPAPPDPLADASAPEARGYVSTPTGQLHAWRLGATGQRPAVVLPELPGTAPAVAARLTELAAERPAWTFDLPGQGESGPLPRAAVGDFADALAACLDALELQAVDVTSIFTSSPIALALATRRPDLVQQLTCRGMPLLAARERRRAAQLDAPDVTPRWDGAHLTTLWHRLRDAELAWPWHAREAAAARCVPVDLNPARLTALVTDLAQQPEHWAMASSAALSADTASLLRACPVMTLVLGDARDPRDLGLEALARRLPHIRYAARWGDREIGVG
jgi:pimeloyl-ACP methyl ester carboxylesterase